MTFAYEVWCWKKSSKPDVKRNENRTRRDYKLTYIHTNRELVFYLNQECVQTKEAVKFYAHSR